MVLVRKVAAAMGGKGIKWLFRDDFAGTLAAGSVNGTAASPGPGTRSVVDTGNDLSIGSGVQNVAGGTNTWGDPGIWLDGVTRTAGRLLVTELTIADTNRLAFVWCDTQDSNANSWEDGIYLNAGGIHHIGSVGSPDMTVGAYSTATSYKFASVLRANGSYLFIKGGAFSNWTLLGTIQDSVVATLYPSITGRLGIYTSDFLRVPDETWLPTPLAYDTFTDDNSTSLDAHTSNTSGPDSQTTPAKSWTEQSGDWDIQSNRANPDGAAVATVDAGDADVMIDCVVNGGAGDQPAIVLRYSDANNYWYLQADRANNQLELHEVDAGSDDIRANAGVTINNSTDYTLRAIANGTTIDGYIDNANKISYGSASSNQTETEHGIRAENTAGQFDNFQIFPRSNNNPHGKLDRYTR